MTPQEFVAQNDQALMAVGYICRFLSDAEKVSEYGNLMPHIEVLTAISGYEDNGEFISARVFIYKQSFTENLVTVENVRKRLDAALDTELRQRGLMPAL